MSGRLTLASSLLGRWWWWYLKQAGWDGVRWRGAGWGYLGPVQGFKGFYGFEDLGPKNPKTHPPNPWGSWRPRKHAKGGWRTPCKIIYYILH